MYIRTIDYMNSIAIIGNGLYVRSGHMSWMDQLKAKQRQCSHKERDPRGTCYNCGQREAKPVAGGEGGRAQ